MRERKNLYLQKRENWFKTPYHALAYSIIELAARDYKDAVRKNAEAKKASLRRFFASQYCDLLAGEETHMKSMPDRIEKIMEERKCLSEQSK